MTLLRKLSHRISKDGRLRAVLQTAVATGKHNRLAGNERVLEAVRQALRMIPVGNVWGRGGFTPLESFKTPSVSVNPRGRYEINELTNEVTIFLKYVVFTGRESRINQTTGAMMKSIGMILVLVSLTTSGAFAQRALRPVRIKGYVTDVIHPPDKIQGEPTDIGRLPSTKMYFFKSLPNDLFEYALIHQRDRKCLSIAEKADFALGLIRREYLDSAGVFRAGSQFERIRFSIRIYNAVVGLSRQEIEDLKNQNVPWRAESEKWPINTPYMENHQIIRIFKVSILVFPIGKVSWTKVVNPNIFDEFDTPPDFRIRLAMILPNPNDQIQHLGTWHLPNPD